MQHVAVYERVSSKQQDTRSQRPDLVRWCDAYCDEEEALWFTDTMSGKSMDRPGWKKLDAEMQVGAISKIVVWRLDRLGRTAAGLTALFEDLQRRGIGLVSVRDGLDLSTAAGRLMANVLASVAAYENEVRAERIRAGQAAARANGVTWGGSKPGRRLKVTDEQVETIRRMELAGESKAAMARATGLSRPTVYSVLNGS